jgi:hypothetical protein
VGTKQRRPNVVSETAAKKAKVVADQAKAAAAAADQAEADTAAADKAAAAAADKLADIFEVMKGDGILPSQPLPVIVAGDMDGLRALVGKYVLVPASKYKKLQKGANHLGWAAKVISFESAYSKVKLQSKGEQPIKFSVKDGSYALAKLVRLN